MKRSLIVDEPARQFELQQLQPNQDKSNAAEDKRQYTARNSTGVLTPVLNPVLDLRAETAREEVKTTTSVGWSETRLNMAKARWEYLLQFSK